VEEDELRYYKDDSCSVHRGSIALWEAQVAQCSLTKAAKHLQLKMHQGLSLKVSKRTQEYTLICEVRGSSGPASSPPPTP
jgi:hypothetical protein